MTDRSSIEKSPGSSISGGEPTAAEERPTYQMNNGQGIIGFDDTGGSGPMVIAVPGMGDLRREYRYLTPYLTAEGYRVVTADVRGHGASSPEWDDYSARAVGQDILALMTHLGQSNAIIVGNSFSAGAALWAAHDAPERVSEAVLIGPVLRDPPKGIPWYLRAVLAIGLGGPWRVRFWLTYWTSLFPTRKPADFASYRRALGNNLRETGRMTALKSMIYLPKADTETMLTKTELPVLVVMGTRDADFPDPPAEAKWAAARLGAQLLLVQGAGHYPQTEMPEQVGSAVASFLRNREVVDVARRV